MKYIPPGKPVVAKCNLAKDLHWKIFGLLIEDLDLPESIAKPFLAAVRGRSVDGLLDSLEGVSLQCILDTCDRDEEFFFKHAQLVAFLKKFPFNGQNTRQKAFMVFKKAERICELFNLENYRALLSVSGRHPKFFRVISELRDDIKTLLGKVPDCDSIAGSAVHGPGVSIGDHYEEGKVTAYYKLSSIPYTVTRCTLPYARTAIESDPRWIGALQNDYRVKHDIPMYAPINLEQFFSWVFCVVDGSRITSVPKTAIIDRTIAVEPLMNVFLQLGVDKIIKSHLKKKWGYNLADQSRNQALAKEGSLTGEFATLDLSMASDTISLKLCEMLLPSEWYNLLLDLRCPCGTLEDEIITFSKISSMGNGCTFALETVIFGALTRAAIRRTESVRISAVYGDDIVAPTTAVSYLTDLLNLSGFSLNSEKSFSSGHFRESCGADYFRGINVRPVYLKRRIVGISDLFYIHNILLWRRDQFPWYWSINFERTLQFIRHLIPSQIREQFAGPISEDFDSYFFKDDYQITFRKKGYGYRFQLGTVARTFNEGTDFLYRKLMARLKHTEPHAFLDKRRLPSTGNAFDVTRRDRTRVICVKVELPDRVARTSG